MANDYQVNITEFNIPVPWGHIAAKSWGDESNTHVLVFHGRSDNAGAFDNLIPLLPKQFYYICLDLPSHGKSSHFPPHTPLYTTNFLLTYSYVMNYFKKEAYTVIGHSYGGHLAFLYSRLYPGRINKLSMIDTIYYDIVEVNEFTNHLVGRFEAYMKLTEKLASGKKPSYTYEDAKKRLMFSRETEPLTDAAATALLKRNLVSVGENKYVFSTDQRMKHYFNIFHDYRYAIEHLEKNPIECPVQILLGNKNKAFHDIYKPQLDVLKRCDNVTIKYVDGGHDVHNNNPEAVAPHISKFLLEESPVTRYIPKKPTSLSWFSRVLRLAKL